MSHDDWGDLPPEPHGHNPFGAMLQCSACGMWFRTLGRLRAHEDNDQDLCRDMARERARR